MQGEQGNYLSTRTRVQGMVNAGRADDADDASHPCILQCQRGPAQSSSDAPHGHAPINRRGAIDAALAIHAPPPLAKLKAMRASPPRAQHLFTGLLPLPWRPTSMEWSMSVVWIPAAALPESD